MFCRRCGKELDEKYTLCPYCGESVHLQPPKYSEAPGEKTGMKALGFALGFFGVGFWPILIVALVLYLLWHDNMPYSADAMGKFALIGVAVSMAITVFVTAMLVMGFLGIIICLSLAMM